MISELAIATLGVRDLAVTRRFYESQFGYVCRGESAVPPELHELWQLDSGNPARCALLAAPGATRGLLRLIACRSPGPHVWGNYERYFDYGYYAVNIRVPDVRAIHAALLAAGARQKSPPTHWVIEPGHSAWDSLSWDPDGTLLDVYTTEGRPDIARPIAGVASALETIAIHVGDAGRAREFYQALGFALFFDRQIDDLGAFFHLPDGVVLHDVNLYKPQYSGIGRVEIVQYRGLPGAPLGRGARAPRLGIHSISFETDDLIGSLATVHAAGGTLLTDPVTTTLPGLGRVRLAMAEGPDQEWLEFYERA